MILLALREFYAIFIEHNFLIIADGLEALSARLHLSTWIILDDFELTTYDPIQA